MNLRNFYFTVFLTIIVANPVNAQLFGISVDKDAKHAKKVSKSDAVKEIRIVERNIAKIDNLLQKSDEYIVEKKFEEFSLRLDSIQDNIPDIKSKDPKWKPTEEYQASQQQFKSKKEQLQPLHDKYSRKQELKSKLYEINELSFSYDCNKINHVLDYNLDAVNCARMFEAFYLDVFQKRKVRALLEEYKKLASEEEMTSTIKTVDYRYGSGFKGWENTIVSDASEFLVELNKIDFNTNSNAWSRYYQYQGYLNYLKTQVDVVNQVNPSDDKKELLEKLENKAKEMKAFLLKSNMINEENLGKVVFTSKDMTKSEFKAAEKATTWDMKGPLCYRYFFEKPPIEYDMELGEVGRYTNDKADIIAEIYLNDKKILEFEVMDFSNAENMYLTVQTLREDLSIQKQIGAELSKGSYGKYPLRIEHYLVREGKDKKSSLMAAGEITVIYNENTKNIFRGNAEICLEPKKMSNASLEQKFLSFANKMKNQGDTFFEQSDTFTKIRIIDSGWITDRTEYQKLIKGRSINAIVVGKDKDGNCIKQLVEYYEDYQSGSYDNLQISGASKSEVIPCFCF